MSSSNFSPTCAIIEGTKYKRARMISASTPVLTVERCVLSMATSNYTTYSIYRIVNKVTQRCYVGKTADLMRRSKDHFRLLSKSIHTNVRLQAAANKHGLENLVFEIVETCISADSVNDREMYWIRYYDSFNTGYNLTEGGEKDTTTHTKPCTWNGIEYRSISEAARANGVSFAVMHTRISKGYTRDSDFVSSRHPIEYNGVKYPSISAAARANNIASATLAGRVERGYKSDDDMQVKPVIWNGVEYRSRRQLCIALGVGKYTLMRYLRDGYTCDADIPEDKRYLGRLR